MNSKFYIKEPWLIPFLVYILNKDSTIPWITPSKKPIDHQKGEKNIEQK
jgi:hypothetical protein